MITFRLSRESHAFVSFMLRHFGSAWVKALNARTNDSRWQYVTSEVEHMAHLGEYEQVPRSYEMPAYTLAWVLQSGRVNGKTHLAIRQMDVTAILQLIAAIREQDITGNAVARYMMEVLA